MPAATHSNSAAIWKPAVRRGPALFRAGCVLSSNKCPAAAISSIICIFDLQKGVAQVWQDDPVAHLESFQWVQVSASVPRVLPSSPLMFRKVQTDVMR